MVLRIKELKEGIIVTAFVKPSSRRDAIKISDELQIETREPPSRNAANLGVIKLISKAVGVPGSSVSIVRGSADKVKEIYIKGLSIAEFERRFKEFLQKRPEYVE
jgi:uncharacterized protein YggU (UPF0235/DUF167 family)